MGNNHGLRVVEDVSSSTKCISQQSNIINKLIFIIFCGFLFFITGTALANETTNADYKDLSSKLSIPIKSSSTTLETSTRKSRMDFAILYGFDSWLYNPGPAYKIGYRPAWSDFGFEIEAAQSQGRFFISGVDAKYSLLDISLTKLVNTPQQNPEISFSLGYYNTQQISVDPYYSSMNKRKDGVSYKLNFSWHSEAYSSYLQLGMPNLIQVGVGFGLFY